jgi:hypothetical protein
MLMAILYRKTTSLRMIIIFFEDDHHIMISDVPIYRTSTFYSRSGDFLVYISYFYVFSIMIYLIIVRIRKKISA